MNKQRYAVRTDVPVEDSRADVEELLANAGTEEFVSGWAEGRAFLAFTIGGRSIRMPIPMPTRAECARTPAGKRRTPLQTERAYEQALRARWRAVVLVIKAKLEACAVGISTIEREFLWDLALKRNGKTYTVGDLLSSQLETVLTGAETPRLLPAPGSVPVDGVAQGEFLDV